LKLSRMPVRGKEAPVVVAVEVRVIVGVGVTLDDNFRLAVLIVEYIDYLVRLLSFVV
jgi:hypothetical protein